MMIARPPEMVVCHKVTYRKLIKPNLDDKCNLITTTEIEGALMRAASKRASKSPAACSSDFKAPRWRGERF
jgi:hypothetical protein